MKKVFIQPQFGEPHAWTQKYIDHVEHLEKYGWHWLLFTPNDFKSTKNVTIIPMTALEFDKLVEKKLGVLPKVFIPERGIPSVHMTDFYVYSGVIYEDYLKDADFWGTTNMDIVFGRLDHFLPDSYLEDCDVFSDDTDSLNGVFSLWRNIPKINNLFKNMVQWQDVLGQDPCRACLTSHGQHTLYASDEYLMTDVLKKDKNIRYKQPKYYPLHSHDRLENHRPIPKLEIKNDGSLWELLRDVNGPSWIHARPFIGREIPYFHFNTTKKWPL